MRLATSAIFPILVVLHLLTPTNAAETTLREPQLLKLGPNAKIYSFAISDDGSSAYLHARLNDSTRPELKDAVFSVNLHTGKIDRILLAHLDVKGWTLGERMKIDKQAKCLILSGAIRKDKTRFIRSVDLVSGRVLFEIEKPWTSISDGWEPGTSADGKTVYANTVDVDNTQTLHAWDVITGLETRRLNLPSLKNLESEHTTAIFGFRKRLVAIQSVIRGENAQSHCDAEVTICDLPTLKVVRSWRVENLFIGSCITEPAPVFATEDYVYAVVEDSRTKLPLIKTWRVDSAVEQASIVAPPDLPVSRIHVLEGDKLILAAMATSNEHPVIGIYDNINKKWIDYLDTNAFGRGYVSPIPSLEIGGAVLAAKHSIQGDRDNPSGEDRLAIFDLAPDLQKTAKQPK